MNTITADRQRKPKVAALAQGFVTIWHSDFPDPEKSEIRGQIFDPSGNRKGPEFLVGVAAHVGSNGNQVATTASGFVAIWHSQNLTDGLRSEMFGQLFDANGNRVGNRIHLNTYTDDHQWWGKALGLPTGFIGVWSSRFQDPDGSQGIYGRLFNNLANPIGPEFAVFTGNGTQSTRSIAALPYGFAVMWHSTDELAPGIDSLYAQRFYFNTSAIGSPILMHDPSTHVVGSASLSEVSGGIVAVWAAGENGSEDTLAIQAQPFDYDLNSVGSSFNVSRGDASFRPLDGDMIGITNGMVATWHANTTEDEQDVFAQIFDLDTNYVGSAFRVNSHTEDDQGYPTIVALPFGFAITWESAGQDPDGSQGVYGRIFTYTSPLTSNSSTSMVTTNDVGSTLGATSVFTAADEGTAPLMPPLGDAAPSTVDSTTPIVLAGIFACLAGLLLGGSLRYVAWRRRQRVGEAGQEASGIELNPEPTQPDAPESEAPYARQPLGEQYARIQVSGLVPGAYDRRPVEAPEYGELELTPGGQKEYDE